MFRIIFKQAETWAFLKKKKHVRLAWRRTSGPCCWCFWACKGEKREVNPIAVLWGPHVIISYGPTPSPPPRILPIHSNSLFPPSTFSFLPPDAISFNLALFLEDYIGSTRAFYISVRKDLVRVPWRMNL
jgi:hypothetical protein